MDELELFALAAACVGAALWVTGAVTALVGGWARAGRGRPGGATSAAAGAAGLLAAGFGGTLFGCMWYNVIRPGDEERVLPLLLAAVACAAGGQFTLVAAVAAAWRRLDRDLETLRQADPPADPDAGGAG